MKRFVSCCSVAASFSICTAAAAADYGAKGPETTTTTDLASGFGGSGGGKLVVPNGAGPYPLLVLSHGFSASADNQVGWGEQFASWGFVVAAPTFPGGIFPDHAKNATVVQDFVRLLSAGATDTPARGKVDASRLGLEGHSAGGLATALAAAKLHPTAVVLFDPVDASDLGKGAFGSVCSPVLSIFTPPSACNSSSNWWAFKDASTGPATMFRIKDATHCDGENAPRGLCGLTCGGAAADSRQLLHARYATAFFMANIKGDGDAAAALSEGNLAANGTFENIVVRAATGATCGGQAAPTPPAGGTRPVANGGNGTAGGAVAPTAAAPPPPAARTATPEGAGAEPPGARSAGPTVATVGEGNHGCSATPAGRPPSAWALLGLASLFVLGRRRRA